MYDPEDARKPPTTWREYLTQSKEIFGAIHWALREFKTPATSYWYRHLIAGVVIATAFSAWQFKLFAAFVNGAVKHNLQLTIFGTAGFLLCLVINRMVDNWLGVAREHLLGLNNGELDHVVSARFFEKSVGQHIEENYRLNPESIMTGRERLLSVQSLLLFEGLPTMVALVFSYVLLWIMSPTIGVILSASIALYMLYLLYLNQKVLEVCTPIEIGWRALKRYRVERMKNVERVKTSAKEDVELGIMDDRFGFLIKRDLSFWLWYIRQTFWRGDDPYRWVDGGSRVRDQSGLDRSLAYRGIGSSRHVELGNCEQHVAGGAYRASAQLVYAFHSAHDRSDFHSARDRLKDGCHRTRRE